jgi:RimJ/RimL family protein N-acetyltransferase
LKYTVFNAKQTVLRANEIRTIVEIECHEKVREWLIEYVGGNVDKEYRTYKRFFRNLPKNKRAEILVARHNGNVVGFLGLWRLGRYMEHVGTLGVSVHPDYWGNGIATKLINSAIKLAKRKGFARLEIETLRENRAMRRVAEKSGFKLEGIRKKRLQKDGGYHDEASYFMLLDNA